MTDRSVLEERRDQALRDLLDLDRQVSQGDMPPMVAAGLRRRYEVVAARTLGELEQVQESAVEPRRARPRSSAVRAAYGVTVAGALLALLVLLPTYVGQRPAGGSVTGNEVMQPPSDRDPRADAAPRDLSTVSDADLEMVVAANPDVIDIRLALANRYADGGNYGAAVRHYTIALQQQPDNVEALAHFGWALLQLDDIPAATRSVDQALEQDPQHQEALWFKANIELYGRSDPAAAVVVLERLSALEGLEATVRRQVDDLMALARERQAAGG